MHRVDAFGNSPGVCQKLAEGIGSLPGWHKGIRQKKTETRRKIIGGSEKLAGIRTMWWDLTGSSLGDSSKESGSSLGTQREITEKKTRGLAVRLPEVARICGMISQRVPSELPDPFNESPSKLMARSHRIGRAQPDAQA
ncbi:hypothetical protein BHE74_00051812 [Ensete ventricosum]|nr:hypothetical protein GW17_00049753 [Ensete ventricosum]RWW42617.1 hypothetical protein BHE74_00051812 [Ensete ventricosum]